MVGTQATGKWVKKIVSCGGVFDLAVEQPQLFRKLPKKQKQQQQQKKQEKEGITSIL